MGHLWKASISLICCGGSSWRHKMSCSMLCINSSSLMSHDCVLTEVLLDLSNPDDLMFWFNHWIKGVTSFSARGLLWVLFKTNCHVLGHCCLMRKKKTNSSSDGAQFVTLGSWTVLPRWRKCPANWSPSIFTSCWTLGREALMSPGGSECVCGLGAGGHRRIAVAWVLGLLASDVTNQLRCKWQGWG